MQYTRRILQCTIHTFEIAQLINALSGVKNKMLIWAEIFLAWVKCPSNMGYLAHTCRQDMEPSLMNDIRNLMKGRTIAQFPS